MSLRDFSLREMGAIPISIGTSLAIEALRQPNVPNYDALWVNLRTLFRNLMSCVPTHVRDDANDREVAEVLEEEMGHISEAVSILSNGTKPVKWYITKPETLSKILPDAIIRAPKTPLQKSQAALCDAALGRLLAKYQKEIQVFSPIMYGQGKAMVLTHFPEDLLSRKHFAEMYLLESHTGKIKEHDAFNTKLGDIDQFPKLPFNGFTLTVFGDKQVLIYQMPNKIRTMVLEVAKKAAWTPMTTKDRMLLTLNNIKNQYDREVLKSILMKCKY